MKFKWTAAALIAMTLACGQAYDPYQDPKTDQPPDTSEGGFAPGWARMSFTIVPGDTTEPLAAGVPDHVCTSPGGFLPCPVCMAYKLNNGAGPDTLNPYWEQGWNVWEPFADKFGGGNKQ